MSIPPVTTYEPREHALTLLRFSGRCLYATSSILAGTAGQVAKAAFVLTIPTTIGGAVASAGGIAIVSLSVQVVGPWKTARIAAELVRKIAPYVWLHPATMELLTASVGRSAVTYFVSQAIENRLFGKKVEVQPVCDEEWELVPVASDQLDPVL